MPATDARQPAERGLAKGCFWSSLGCLAYCSWTLNFSVYKVAVLGAVAELLWLPMLAALVVAPAGALYALAKSRPAAMGWASGALLLSTATAGLLVWRG